MRRTTRLKKLRISALNHLGRLRQHIVDIAPTMPERIIEMKMSFVAIQLQNLWANFVRGFYLSCMLGTRKEGGAVVTVRTPGLPLNTALGRAVRTFRAGATPNAAGAWHRRDEPKWHETRVIDALSFNEGFSNRTDILAALSISSRVFLDLPVFRNFFAHKSEQTSHAARNLSPLYGMAIPKKPSQVLLGRAMGRPQRLIEDWIDDLSLVMEYMCLGAQVHRTRVLIRFLIACCGPLRGLPVRGFWGRVI
jgi:hypothetical protein